jgi:insulysin
MYRVLSSLLLALWLLTPLTALELPEKHELDEREYRRFTLENGLKVILVHDPKLNKSSAAMDVAVGSLSDPKEHQGLAHFLEHMLFLGTRKYPDEKDYHNFLRSRGGYNNAFTAGNHSNYHFQIHHDAFEGALDRFAQFFIAPLFNPEFSKREIQAVHNEHQRNLMEDSRRQYQLLKQFVDPEHPEKHFSTGNEETLKNVTPEVLRAFYDQHYSANRMALALYSQNNLDWMEAQVKEKFSAVPNRKLKTIRYPENFVNESKALRVLHMKPVKDLREMTLIFPWPSLDQHFFSQPGGLIGTILGHEGKGSLLSLLKSQGLATGLSAGGYGNTSDYATFYLSVDLTTKGLAEHAKVLDMIFGAISHLKEKGYPHRAFEEERHVQQLAKVFKYRGEGAGAATNLAGRLNRYPMDWAELYDFRLTEKDPKAYSIFLNKLVPERAILLLMDRSLETDQKEEYYGTEFKAYESKELFDVAKKADVPAGFHFPLANPFLPKKAVALPEVPVTLIDDQRMKLLYQQDTTFRKPKVTLFARFNFPTSRVNLDFSTRLSLAITCLNEQLNELTYPAHMADLSFSLRGNHEGVTLSCSGYDDSFKPLLDRALPLLVNLELEEGRFDALFEKMKRGLDNFQLSQAYDHVRWASRQYRTETVFSPEDKISAIQNIDFPSMKRFIQSLWQGVYMESLVHGNLTQLQAQESIERIWKDLGAKALTKGEDLMKQGFLVHQKETKSVFQKKLQTNNSVFRKDIFLGPDSPEQRVVTKLLSNFTAEPFFSEMRTKQQLGYMVFGSAFQDQSQHYLVYVIQSGTHTADELSKRANAFTQTLPEALSNLPPEKFKAMKDSIREKLLEKPKTIAGKASQLFNLAYTERGNYGLIQQQLSAIEKLSQEDCVATLKKALSDQKQPSAEWQFFSKKNPIEGLDYEAQLTAFRKNNTYKKL